MGICLGHEGHGEVPSTVTLTQGTHSTTPHPISALESLVGGAVWSLDPHCLQRTRQLRMIGKTIYSKGSALVFVT